MRYFRYTYTYRNNHGDQHCLLLKFCKNDSKKEGLGNWKNKEWYLYKDGKGEWEALTKSPSPLYDKEWVFNKILNIYDSKDKFEEIPQDDPYIQLIESYSTI